MSRLSLLLMIFSAACTGTPDRPDANVCVVNSALSQLECFNLKHDYGEDGKLKPDAAVTLHIFASPEDINKYVCVDPTGFTALKTYVGLVRDHLKRCEGAP